MDLDDYYAEQERMLNLPHETLEEYYHRIAVLKRESMEQHVDLFSAANAAVQLPFQEISRAQDAPGGSGVPHCKATRKMSENEDEFSSKRQKVGDQEKAGDYPALMQDDHIAAAQSPHSSSSVPLKFQPPIRALQMNEDDVVEPNLNGAQLEQGRRSPYSSFAGMPDNIPDSTKLELRASFGQPGKGRVPSCNEQGSKSPASVTRRISLSYSSDCVQDDIDSFTEDSIMPLGFKPNHAAIDILPAAPEISPIGSFSMRLGSGNRRHIQELVPTRRQQRLELRPIDDVARVIGKKPERDPDSPIEGVSLVPTTSTTVSRKVIPGSSIHTTRVAKHAMKQTDKPLKRTTKTADQPAGELAPVAEGSTSTPSSPQLQAASVVATSPKTTKKVDKHTKTPTEKPKLKGKKVKPQLMTPVEYVQMLHGKTTAGCANSNDEERSLKKHRKRSVRFLEGKNIFYTGGDMMYASETTRGRMDIIVRIGGNLMPEFDPQVTTHVITDANILPTLRALGMKSLKNIPDHIPTVRWSWVLSVLGKESLLSQNEIEKKLGDTWLHAAFSERMDAGYQPQKTVALASLRDKSRSRVIDKTHAPPLTASASKAPLCVPVERAEHNQDVAQNSTKASAIVPIETSSGEDSFPRFYLEAQRRDDGCLTSSILEDSDDAEEIHIRPMKPTKRGWTCDAKEPQMVGGCPNQDIIDKLEELMQLHKAKVGDEDHWRAFTYNKCIRALRNYPKRIETSEEARMIRGIGERTAQKIEEILQTGGLRRIKYENTEDVVVTRLFQGIYGVGQTTAMQWWSAGCRTLDDLREGKCGVKLSSVQEIGLLYYDDINDRMPREEAKAIFDVIKKIALEIDPNIFVEIMGSYRRGKSTCGDIDVLITRPTDDGQTHSGVLPRLLKELHAAKILTEDLALPDNPGDLEAIYRGLCMRPGIPNARRRRIDFLCVPWISRGAALIYYTGDDIFNRAMRLKANVKGYSLNQRGLFGNVIRDPRDRRVKLNDGVLIASETEEEIFKILEVPWQEPHERGQRGVLTSGECLSEAAPCIYFSGLSTSAGKGHTMSPSIFEGVKVNVFKTSESCYPVWPNTSDLPSHPSSTSLPEDVKYHYLMPDTQPVGDRLLFI